MKLDLEDVHALRRTLHLGGAATGSFDIAPPARLVYLSCRDGFVGPRPQEVPAARRGSKAYYLAFGSVVDVYLENYIEVRKLPNEGVLAYFEQEEDPGTISMVFPGAL